ncbi:MAG: sensor histidine kinase [Promethearchaeota archaeon]
MGFIRGGKFINRFKNINQENKLKILIMIVLLAISYFITYYFQIILKTNVVYSHFFYIPIILACLWWKKKGLVVPLFLAGLLIFFPGFGSSIISLNNIENILRASMLLIIGIIVAALSGHISRVEKLCKTYDRVLLYRDIFTHDINNIIQIIHSSIELYSIYKNRPESLKRFENLIDVIREQIAGGKVLISNIQSLLELEDPNTNINLEKIDLLKVLKDAINFINVSFENRNINIEIKVPNNKFQVKANKLLFNVFENILINAIKYNENPIIEIIIRISKKQIHDENYLKLEFIDNGMGISDEMKKIIFKKGYNKEKFSKGMGLGLSLVKKIIESYNGQIWVENRIVEDYLKGSNFIILFPEAF